jgi:16S rRNA (adenine1518-N6/adenine1519-N6)-dimethyltransferase
MDIQAKKSLGQNFLINQGVVERIIKAGELTSNDKIIEVGPGKGVLTQALADRAGSVIAIEKDHRLIEELGTTVGARANVSIVEGDVLEWKPVDLKAGEYKIIANIPYYITSHFIRTALEDWPRPLLIILMVQKEVAKRIVAQPPHSNLLALSVQMYAKPEIVMNVSRGSFRPVPNVDSAILKLTPYPTADSAGDNERVFRIIRAGFHAPRKQLINNLLSLSIPRTNIEHVLTSVGIAPNARPENLTLDQWKHLANALPQQSVPS